MEMNMSEHMVRDRHRDIWKKESRVDMTSRLSQTMSV